MLVESVIRVYLKKERLILGIAFWVVFLAAWELLARVGVINAFISSYPTRIAQHVVERTLNDDLLVNVGYTLAELITAFTLATAVGVTLGAFMSLYRIVEDVIGPFMWLLFTAPLMALYPLMVIWLGIGARIAVALGFMFAFVFICVNTLAGIREVDPVLIRAARSFGASRRVVFFRVMIPGALPVVVGGLRLGLGRALIGVIVGEMFSTNKGLGYLISWYGTKLQFDDLFASLVLVVLMGIGGDQILKNAELRFGLWRVRG